MALQHTSFFSPTQTHTKIFYMKHNSAVCVDAYFQMGRSFVQLLSRTTAFDNLRLSLKNKCHT